MSRGLREAWGEEGSCGKPWTRRRRRLRAAARALVVLGVTLVSGRDVALATGGEAGAERREIHDGRPVVRLSAEQQQDAALVSKRAQIVTLAIETTAHGTVVDLSPLVRRRGDWHAARAEAEIAATKLEAARRTHERLRTLHADAANVSERRLLEAEATWREAEALHEAARLRVDEIQVETRLSWGAELTALAFAERGDGFETLLEGGGSVIRLVVPAGGSPLGGRTRVVVDPAGDRSRAREAVVLGAAPAADPRAAGETWFVRTAADGLRTGMRVAAWLSRENESRRAMRIPASAVVWHAGRPWAYARLGPERFVRREIEAYERGADGWLVTEGLGAGDEIVHVGGQILLSEEFRWNIPDEDEVD